MNYHSLCIICAEKKIKLLLPTFTCQRDKLVEQQHKHTLEECLRTVHDAVSQQVGRRESLCSEGASLELACQAEWHLRLRAWINHHSLTHLNTKWSYTLHWGKHWHAWAHCLISMMGAGCHLQTVGLWESSHQAVVFKHCWRDCAAFGCGSTEHKRPTLLPEVCDSTVIHWYCSPGVNSSYPSSAEEVSSSFSSSAPHSTTSGPGPNWSWSRSAAD